MAYVSVPNTYRHYGVVEGDIGPDIVDFAHRVGITACDIETTGLTPGIDRLATFQLFMPNDVALVVRPGSHPPTNLIKLLQSPGVTKVFHHATFDLTFTFATWRVLAASVFCTKIASKVLEPHRTDHSLKTLLAKYFGVHISKAQRVSDWSAPVLSREQVEYALNDVIYLPSLIGRLSSELVQQGRWNLALSSFQYLPTRVALDVLGSGDVFKY
ncbi:MAG: ribonuclease D [Planctomycetes bacterium]|nr:ribonuclease D [Planctomycetota bacterium]